MTTRLEITSAQDLIAALESPDLGLRMAIQRTLAKSPEKALSYGAYQGRDCLDVLMAQGRDGNSSLALMACATLSAVSDPRVTDFFLERLEHGSAQALTAAAAYLSMNAFERPRAYPALMGNTFLLRARYAARVLGPPLPEDPPAVALRLAILDPDSTLPPRSGIWEPLWAAELEGICGADARAGLGLQEAPGERAVSTSEERSKAELLAALEDSDWRVRARAADGLIALGEAGLVKPLVSHEQLAVRAAAVQILMALGEHEWLEKTLLAA